MNTRDIPIPEEWPSLVRQAVLHLAALARWTMIYVHTIAHDHETENVRLASAIERRDHEIALLNEQLRILAARIKKIPPKNRPFYPPPERMAILTLKAARGWNNHQTATALGVTEETISNWMHEIDREGPNALVQIPIPVNKYPDFLAFIIHEFKVFFPCLGKKTMAEYFMRAGLHLSASSVGRFLKSKRQSSPLGPHSPKVHRPASRRIVSHHPNHIWLVDLTTVPISGGFWTSWRPFSFAQRWPFCWWILFILDHFSRQCVGFAIFKKAPSSAQVQQVLNKAIWRNKPPKHLISDKGAQFWPPRAQSIGEARNHPYHAWCRRKRIRPRFGAVGRHGSIAIIERFIRTCKTEGTRQIIIPLDLKTMRRELALYCTWYNQYRPHQALNAQTPREAYDGKTRDPPAWCFRPNSQTPNLSLEFSHFEGRTHLPVIKVKRAA